MLDDQRFVVSTIVPSLEMVIGMIEKNIFRPLPNKKKSTNLGMSETGIEQEEQTDPSWPHLQVKSLKNSRESMNSSYKLFST